MSNQYQDDPLDEEKGLTLQELFLIIKVYYQEIIKSWKLVGGIIIIVVSLFVLRALLTPVVYPAQLTFMVNEEEGGGIGGAMVILSQFGFGGGSGGGKYNLEKIIELSKTMRILHLVLFDTLELDGQSDFLANHIIDLYDLHDEWSDSKEERLHNFKFTDNKVEEFDRVANGAMKALQGIIIGSEKKKGIYQTRINDDTGIMTLKVDGLDETFSIALTNSIYHHLSHYYTDKAIEKQQFTFDVVKLKVDSIQGALASAEYRLANFKDSNRRLWSKTSSLEEQRLSRDVQMLTVMYGEAIRNLEIADFSLKNKTPFIQLIDAPTAPISPQTSSKLKAILIGGFLGGILAFGFVIARKFFQDNLLKKEEATI